MKKTMFKRIFAGIAAVFTLGLCVPTGFTGTDLKPSFEATAGTANYNDNLQPDENGVLTVPKRTTTRIAQFRGNDKIKKVKISDNCTIEGNTFWGCTALESVEIGDGCDIRKHAFWECKALESVIFDNGCTIAQWAFNSCNNIQKVIYTGSKDSVTVEKAGNPEIICNKDKWLTATKCPKCQGPVIDYICESCGYIDKATAQAEIDANEAEIEQKENEITQKQERNAYLSSLLKEEEDTASTFSDGNDRNKRKTKAKNKNTTDEEDTASTFSDGSVLAIIGFSTFLILCGLAAVIIVKRRKKTQ